MFVLVCNHSQITFWSQKNLKNASSMPFHYCAPFVFYRNMKSKDICIKFRHEITSTRAQNTTYVIDKVCMIVSRLLKNIFKDNIYNNFLPEPFGPLQDRTKLKIFEIGDIRIHCLKKISQTNSLSFWIQNLIVWSGPFLGF